MLISTTFGEESAPERVCDPDRLMEAQRVVRHLPVGEKVVEAILRLVRAARPDEGGAADLRNYIAWGPGPRASQAFMLAVRAKALIDGRLAPSVDDVADLAHPILRHRMALNFSARAEGTTLTDVIDRLCRSCL
jgi:MoxR-like ATPase